jgi:hypothetical protein
MSSDPAEHLQRWVGLQRLVGLRQHFAATAGKLSYAHDTFKNDVRNLM